MAAQPEKTITELIQYNNWANQQVLTACQKLSHSQLTATMPGAYGSIYDTLKHIIEGEAYYVSLLTGNRPRPPFQWETGPDLTEVRDYAAQVGNALVDAIGRIGPTDQVFEEEDGNKFRYQALAIFIQIINHGVEHRTNITTILSAEQHTVPAVDGWGYLSAHPERFDYQVS